MTHSNCLALYTATIGLLLTCGIEVVIRSILSSMVDSDELGINTILIYRFTFNYDDSVVYNRPYLRCVSIVRVDYTSDRFGRC